MTIETITPDQLSMFAMTLDGDRPNAAMEAYVEELWGTGESRPEWCFIAMEDGRLAARLLYWSFPSQPEDLFLSAFSIRTGPAAFETGKTLLAKSLDRIAASGPHLIDARIRIPRDTDPELKRSLFKETGFRIVQAKVHLVLPESSAMDGEPWRLRYCSLADVGASMFIDIIERVSHGTLDRLDRLVIEQSGPGTAATKYFETLKDLHFDPEAWQLAFDDTDTVIGLVVPQQIRPDLSAVNYIGVVPSMRGRGYGAELIRRAIHIIHTRYGAQKIAADTDTENLPTREGMRKAGFIEQGVTELFQKAM